MLTKLAEIYNRQDIVDVYKYGVFNYINYFDLLSRFKIYEHKSYQLRIIKRRGYIINDYIHNRTEYCIDDKLHRDNDKPAIENESGTKEWYQNGKLHRDNDKPAVEYADGTRSWWKNGKRYRDDHKPLIEWSDGSEWWYHNGKFRCYKN
jgi:hypothetical protein